MSWFDVDKEGLAKIIEKRGKSFAIFELIQNAWDTDTDWVKVSLEKIPGKPQARLIVEDNHPDGFTDLTHAYTLFAESEKKGDPSKRGRYNLGEKLVLALCVEATVVSTKGTVVFAQDGTRQKKRTKRESGSVFNAVIRMTQAEFDEVEQEMFFLIPPIPTYYNGTLLEQDQPIKTFEATLQTVKSDEEGNLSRTKRKTVVEVYDAHGLDETAGWIFEMGIPVVETGDKFHVNVLQKVPLSLDRDNVPPSYLRQIRAEVLNATHELLDEEDATAVWVDDALSHDDVEEDAVDSVMTDRFGVKRAVYDPSDPEANNRLVSQGYTLIHGGSLSKEAWGNVRRYGSARASGQIAPTPKPYSQDPNASPVDRVDPSKYTQGMKDVVALIERLGDELLDVPVSVTIVNTSNGFSACFGGGDFDLNLRRLGHKWFNNWRDNIANVLDLIIHEFGHHYSDNHLSEEYHDALTSLGGRMAALALKKPGIFG